MRIIAGKFRSRKLLFPPVTTTRPTSDRAREAIFNIIQSFNDDFIRDSRVLDAFAGSGALGLEALSRGAAQVTFLENNHQTIRVLNENIALLHVEAQCSVIIGDATKPPKAMHAADLIFLDPPYEQNLERPCLNALFNQGWIHPKSLIVLETSAKKPPTLPEKAALIDQRRYGTALISFLKLSK